MALHQADVSFSVDNATEIARETSDIILLKKDLSILNEIIIEGRKTSMNILKYIKMTLASQLGDILSLLIALLLLPIIPMLPIQILFKNLLYDLGQTLIA
jgi:Mg2+-importing ATPase